MAVTLTTTTTADSRRYRESVQGLLTTWFGLTDDASVMQDMELEVIPGGSAQMKITLSRILTPLQVAQLREAIEGEQNG